MAKVKRSRVVTAAVTMLALVYSSSPVNADSCKGTDHWIKFIFGGARCMAVIKHHEILIHMPRSNRYKQLCTSIHNVMSLSCYQIRLDYYSNYGMEPCCMCHSRKCYSASNWRLCAVDCELCCSFTRPCCYSRLCRNWQCRKYCSHCHHDCRWCSRSLLCCFEYWCSLYVQSLMYTCDMFTCGIQCALK